MPPKQLKSKASTTSEVQNKVREIRVKQQKWLEEREKSLKTGAPTKHCTLRDKLEQQKTPLTNGVNCVPSDRPKQTLQNVSTASAGKNISQNINMSAKTPMKSGFHTWISNKQLQNESPQNVTPPQYNPSNYNDYDLHCGDDEIDMSPIKMQLSYTAASSAGSRVVDSDLHLDHHSSSSPRNQSLSPKKFDALADEIINRVKRELHLEMKEASTGDKASMKMNSTPVKRQSMDESFSPGNYMCDISSHNCPVCHELMLPPMCRPQLLIPCGHTSCQKCVRQSRSCQLCNHHIQSSTPNIILQQIIIDYHQRPHDQVQSPDEPSVTKRSHLEGNTPPVHQLGRTYSQIPSHMVAPSTPRKTAQEFEEEYHNLLLRCDVLRDEEQVICDKMESLEQQKQAEHRQVENICSTQKRLQQDIEKLQKQIEALDGHKEGYRAKIGELEMQKKKEKRRLELVRSTISQLKCEINKIKKELQSIH